jgi:hypothetical protein
MVLPHPHSVEFHNTVLREFCNQKDGGEDVAKRAPSIMANFISNSSI